MLTCLALTPRRPNQNTGLSPAIRHYDWRNRAAETLRESPSSRSTNLLGWSVSGRNRVSVPTPISNRVSSNPDVPNRGEVEEEVLEDTLLDAKCRRRSQRTSEADWPMAQRQKCD